MAHPPAEMIRCVPLPTADVWRSFVPFGVDLKSLRRPRNGPPNLAWIYRSRVGTERFHEALRLYLMWRQSMRAGTGQYLALDAGVAGNWLDAFARIPCVRYRRNESLVRIHNALVLPGDAEFGWWQEVPRKTVEESLASFLASRPLPPPPKPPPCRKRRRTEAPRLDSDVWERTVGFVVRDSSVTEACRVVRRLRLASMEPEAAALLSSVRQHSATWLADMVRWVRPLYLRMRMQTFRHCRLHAPGEWTDAMRDEGHRGVDDSLREIHASSVQRVMRLDQPLLLRAVDAFRRVSDDPRLQDAFRFTFGASLHRIVLACLDPLDTILERARIDSAPPAYALYGRANACSPLDPQTVERCLRTVARFDQLPRVPMGPTRVRSIDRSFSVLIDKRHWVVRTTGRSVVHLFRGKPCLTAVFDPDEVRTLHCAHATYDEYDQALNAFSVLCASFDRVVRDTGLCTGRCPLCERALSGTDRALGAHPACTHAAFHPQ